MFTENVQLSTRFSVAEYERDDEGEIAVSPYGDPVSPAVSAVTRKGTEIDY